MFNTRNKSRISARPCIILLVKYANKHAHHVICHGICTPNVLTWLTENKLVRFCSVMNGYVLVANYMRPELFSFCPPLCFQFFRPPGNHLKSKRQKWRKFGNLFKNSSIYSRCDS